MSAISKADSIVQALITRLSTIKKANNYQTSAGKKIIDGQRQSIEADTIAIYETEEDSTRTKGEPYTATAVMHLVIEGVVACTADAPNKAGRRLAADLQKAAFGGDASLEGLLVTPLIYTGRVIQPRLDGQLMVVVQIKLDAIYQLTPANP